MKNATIRRPLRKKKKKTVERKILNSGAVAFP